MSAKMRPYYGHPPHEKQSQLSFMAADAIAENLAGMRGGVLKVIADAGAHGVTDEQIWRRTGANPNTLRPRRRELWQMGLIGTEDSRENHSGRQAAVWKLAKFCKNPVATTATREWRECPRCGYRF